MSAFSSQEFLSEDVMRMKETELDALPRPRQSKTERSQVSEFYNGRCVLITGASGFLGKILTEKLIRACPGVKKVYLLIRPKRNKTTQERLGELLNSVVFDGSRGRDASGTRLLDKVHALQGDVTEKNLDLSETDLATIIEQVSVIFHSAALIGFETSFRRAISANLMSTRNIIELAYRLPKLVSLVHVSSAYSNCYVGSMIEEHLYPVSTDPKTIIEMVENFDDRCLDDIKRSVMGDHPNIYTYTKSLSEWIYLDHASALPIIISRPSVIVGAYREPIPGYVDNMNGSNGVYSNALSGMLRACSGNHKTKLDQVPVDMVANCILALGWFAHLFHSRKRIFKIISDKDDGNSKLNVTAGSFHCSYPNAGLSSLVPSSPSLQSKLPENGFTRHINQSTEATKEQEQEEEEGSDNLDAKLRSFYSNMRAKIVARGLTERMAYLPVIHITSSTEKPISVGSFMNRMLRYGAKYPKSNLRRNPNFAFIKNGTLYSIHSLVVHKLYGFLLDLPNILSGRPIVHSVVFRRLEEYCRVVKYFFFRDWKFDNQNRLTLIESFMSPEDRRLFECDMRRITWNEYCKNYQLAIRRFMFKESLDNLAEARRGAKIIRRRNACFQLVMVLLAFYLIYMVI